MSDKETTDIATRDETLPAEYPDEDPGEGLGDTTVRPPFLSLVQASSDAAKSGDAKPGQWYCSDTGQAFDKLQIVVVHAHEERDRYELGEPSCKSFTCKVPNGNVENPVSDNCENCPDKDWRGKKPPPCRPVQATLVVDVETDEVYSVTFSRTSIKGFKQHLAALRRMKRSLYAGVATLGSKLEQRKGNEYYVAALSDIERVEPWHKYKALFDDAQQQYDAAVAQSLAGPMRGGEDIPF